MNEPRPKRSLIEEAFDPKGPVFDGPKSIGRRTYDQTFWWIRAVKDVGFPIVAAWWVATKLLPTIEHLSTSVDELKLAVQRDSRVTAALICKVAPEDCVKNLEAP